MKNPSMEELFSKKVFTVSWTKENYDFLIKNGCYGFDFEQHNESAIKYSENPSITIKSDNRIYGWSSKIDTDISHLICEKKVEYIKGKGWSL